MHEMRHGIREKHSGEETSDVAIPVHCGFLSARCASDSTEATTSGVGSHFSIRRAQGTKNTPEIARTLCKVTGTLGQVSDIVPRRRQESQTRG